MPEVAWTRMTELSEPLWNSDARTLAACTDCSEEASNPPWESFARHVATEERRHHDEEPGDDDDPLSVGAGAPGQPSEGALDQGLSRLRMPR